MKKMVVMMNVYDERSKESVIRTVASCSGITTITMDSREGKLTVIGEFDGITMLTKLKKKWHNVKMVTFGPYATKKEAETAPAAEKKKKEESKRQGLEFLNLAYPENPVCPMHHHSGNVSGHDHYHGCVIS